MGWAKSWKANNWRKKDRKPALNPELWDEFMREGSDAYHKFGPILSNGGLLDILYIGVKTGLYPSIIFMGVGAMTDFGPMLSNPKSFLLGAAAQFGVYFALIMAVLLGFSDPQAASIGIIGGADGPTAILVTKILAPTLLGAIAIESGCFKTVATVSSSHNSSAERQFRFPLEYGSQRPPTAQWTATASGAFVLKAEEKGDIYINEALPGRIVDKGITDQNNMGAAMAPAAASTLYEYFAESGEEPDSFDMILTGDLGYEGNSICRELLSTKGLRFGKNFSDCGILLYDRERQDTHSGGSGCGCSASVTAGYVMQRFRKGEIKDVLLVGTGALMSPSSVLQGLSIAGIGHLVRLTRR